MLLEREAPLDALLAAARGPRPDTAARCCSKARPASARPRSCRNSRARRQAAAGCCGAGARRFSRPVRSGRFRTWRSALDPRVAALLEQAAAPERLFPALLNALQDAERHDRARLRGRALGRQRDARSRKISRPSHCRCFAPCWCSALRSDEVGADHPLTHVLGDLPSASVTRITLEPLVAPRQLQCWPSRRAAPSADLYRITAGNPVLRHRASGEQRARAGTHPGFRPRRGVVAAVAPYRRRARGAGDDEHRAGERRTVADPGAARRRGRSAGRPCVADGLLRRDAQGALTFRHELARQATLDRLSPQPSAIAPCEGRGGDSRASGGRRQRHAVAPGASRRRRRGRRARSRTRAASRGAGRAAGRASAGGLASGDGARICRAGAAGAGGAAPRGLGL